MEKEELIVYLAAIREAMSAVLMTKREAKKMLIYFVSLALQDFIVERPEDDSLIAPMEVEKKLPDPWTLFTDGSSYVDGFEAGLILTNPEGTEFTYALRFGFDATNNEAEYEALIAGLRIAQQMGISNLQTHVYSRLVANQVNGSYIAKESEVLTVVEEEGNTWMNPIYEYLTEEILPAKKNKTRAVRLKSRRFRLLGEIISDHRNQFRDNPFKDWCEKLSIRQRFASVKHPQANGLVERANRSLGEGMKARLDKGSKDWIKEILHVLWAHHTMIKSSNEDTLFSLTYRMKAVIPVEIGMPTLRTI
ncbi:reverse transcriptase domain-containing protein [Tanacetum coccineum]